MAGFVFAGALPSLAPALHSLGPATAGAQPGPAEAPATGPAGPAAPATGPATAPATAIAGPVAELRGRMVEDVRVVGNTTVSTAVVRNLIRTREGQPFDPATVEEDYQRVVGLRRFANVVPAVEPTATGVVVVFNVTEQKQIGLVAFRGNTRLDSQTLRQTVDLKTGQGIDPFRINLARTAVEKLYRDRNNPFAHVEVDREALAKRGDVIFTITEGPNVRVRRVQVLGNHSYSDSKLKDQVKTRSWIWIFRSGTYDPDQIDADAASIRNFYHDHGFFDARVGRKIIWSPDQTEVMVSFLVDEGQRYVVDQVRFTGNKRVSDAQLRQGMKLLEGRAFDIDILRRDVKQIVKVYSPFGYIYLPQLQAPNPDYLKIDPKWYYRKTAGKVEVVYDIAEGKEITVGRVIIKGNSRAQDKVIVRELRVTPGQKYNSYELQEAAERLKNTRLFTAATITPIGDDPRVRDVLVEVQETQSAFVLLGAGVTSNAGVLGNISYEQRNFDIANVPSSWGELFSNRAFTGAGQYFRIQLEPGTEQSRARITFQEPWVFDQPYSFGSDLYYTTRVREEWNETRLGERVTVGHRFTNELSVRATERAEEVGINSINNKPLRAFEILQARGTRAITGAGFDIRYADIDNPILPGRGKELDFSYEYAGAFGGDFSFHKFQADAAFHQTIREDLLDRKTTLTERLRGGYISGNAPFFERFYEGGLGSVRGFRYRGISPRSGIGKDPVGGDFSLTGTVELNFPIAGEGFRGVLFADAGTCEPTASFGTIRTSVGFGFRITLPVFGQLPLAVDFGIPITKDRLDDTRIVSFSLGFGQ